LYGALVVTLSMLLRLINCRSIIIIYYTTNYILYITNNILTYRFSDTLFSVGRTNNVIVRFSLCSLFITLKKTQDRQEERMMSTKNKDSMDLGKC